MPDDSILVPYEGRAELVCEVNGHEYEHEFAVFAHELQGSERSGPAGSELVLHHNTRIKVGYTLLVLRWPVVAWNLRTNRIMVCQALILVDDNSSGRKDVWSSDNIAMARNMFENL